MPTEADGNSALAMVYRRSDVTAPCDSAARLSAPEYFSNFFRIDGPARRRQGRRRSLLPLPPCPSRLPNFTGNNLARPVSSNT
jgi:hypothetical protein